MTKEEKGARLLVLILFSIVFGMIVSYGHYGTAAGIAFAIAFSFVMRGVK
jgi:hypothetical protein